MATPKNDEEPPPEINSSLLMKSLNFHGQELLRALQVENPDVMKFVDTKCLNYVEYHKRAPQAEFSLRSKRLRLLQFMAKKADMLFKPVESSGDCTEQNEDMYAVMPPIEKYMGVPSSERRMRFFNELQRGDVLIGTVRGRNNPGLPGGPNSKGHCCMQLTCFDGKKKRHIEDLQIKAEIIQGEYNINDQVRGYIYSHSPSTRKVVIGTTNPSETVINSMGDKRTTLGRIGIDDIPRYMKIKDDSMCETLLEKIPSFHNPAAVENLFNAFGLPIGNGCTSLMKKLANSEVSKDEYAPGLKKKQMSLWAMRSRQEGVQLSKEDRVPDAFDCLNNALSIEPENPESLINRGCLFVSMENFEKAIEDFKAALSFDPDNQLARKYISDAYMMLGAKFAAVSDIDQSYENFRRSVEYNSSNHEAVSYLTAIMSVKSISDAEKAAQKISDAEEVDEPCATESPGKEQEEDEPGCPSTTSDVWPTASATAWQNSDSSWLGTYANTSWPGSETSAYAAPSSHWQTAPSAWATSWSSASDPWLMTSSTWTPAMAGSFPIPAASSAVSSIVPEQELSLDKSENTMDMVPLAQLKHMIEEERDRHVLKRSRSHSVSSSSTSTSSRKKRHSSRRKKRRYRDEGSSGDDSGHSSESSLVDDHKQKCEEFVERNRLQFERKKAQSRDSKGTSRKEHREESSSRKDYHRKSEIVHKKDCVKKSNRTSVKEQDKNSHKDSLSITKEQKVNDSSVVKRDSKKTEEKSKVELSPVIDMDLDEKEDPGEMVDDRTSRKEHREESSSRKDYHRKSEIVHKKDCVKKSNRTSVKEQDKNSHKDSVSVTKEQKTNDSSVVKKDSKKTEEKSKVELSHVIDMDLEQEEEPGEIVDDRHNIVKSTGNTTSTSSEAAKPSVLCSAAQDYMDSESREPKRQKVFFAFKKGHNILNKRSSSKLFEDKTVAQYFGKDSDEEDDADAADLDTRDNRERTEGGVFKNSSSSFHRRNYRSSHHDEDLSDSECSKSNETTKASKKSAKQKVSPKHEKVHENSSQHQSSHHRNRHRHYCSKHSSRTRYRDHRDCSPRDSSNRRRHSDSEDEYYHSKRHKDYTDYRERRHYH